MSNETTSHRPYEILVVENDADDLDLFLRSLRRVQQDVGIEINPHTFSDSTLASAQLKEKKFDAIFLDIDMPPPNGMELAAQARATQVNRHTPIVIITGAQDRGLMARAFQAGANMLLFKPVDRMRLLRLIQVSRVPMENERRRLQRVKVSCKVSIESQQVRFDGNTLDLSLNGMGVRASKVLPLGATVNLSLFLPSSAAPIRMAARVVRVVGNDFMGLQLENVGRAESDALAEFLVPLVVALLDGDK